MLIAFSLMGRITILHGLTLSTEISYLEAIILKILAISAYTAFLIQSAIGHSYRTKDPFILLLRTRTGIVGWAARA